MDCAPSRDGLALRRAFSLLAVIGAALLAPLAVSGANRDVDASDSSRGASGLVQRQATGTPNPPITLTIRSAVLGEERRVYVQLPEGYAGSEARYPLLVVVDGEWLFEPARATVKFFSEYDVMDVSIPKMIVVGIENVDRNRDLVPTADRSEAQDFPTAGGAGQFLQFLKQELLPLLGERYRTAPSRTLAGWSFGGLFAVYSSVVAPDLFDGYLCIGPALWWDNEMVLDLYRDVRFQRPKRMVVTLGAREAGGKVYTSTRRLLDRLNERPVEGLEVTHLELQGVGHSWGIPAAFDKGLQRLFAGYVAPDEVSTSSLEALQAHYDQLSATWGYRVLPPVPVMLNLALSRWSAGAKADAIDVLDRLLRYEPDASLAYYYRGVFLERQGREGTAIPSFEGAVSAERRRNVPDRLNLALFNKRLQKLATAPSASGSPAPPR